MEHAVGRRVSLYTMLPGDEYRPPLVTVAPSLPPHLPTLRPHKVRGN